MSSTAAGARAATKLATREALIAGALAEISEHGPHAASLDAICARAGFTRGAFYVHFRDREDLLGAVMERVLGDLVAALRGGAADGDLADGIRQFAAAAATQAPAVHGGRGLRFHHLLEACHTSTAIGDRYRRFLELVAAWARHGVAREQTADRLPRVDPGAAADLLLAAGLGQVVLLELGWPCDPRRIGETLLALLGLDQPPRATRRRRSPRAGRVAG